MARRWVFSRVRQIALAAVLLLVAGASAWLVVLNDNPHRVTAYFTGTVGLYADSDVRMLGVSVGTVDDVEPEGERVKVTMSLDPEYDVPADAGALIITPSLVSDRYVQLSPVYTGGPKLADGGIIPVDRTEVPVELDELFTSLNDLTTALGPDGANSDGALSELLDSAARNLDGNGRELNKTLQELGKAGRTLAGSDEDLFGTVDSLQQFTTMLAGNDEQVREFDKLLAEISEVFADERENFSGALGELAAALEDVGTFVKDNRGKIKSNVDKFGKIAKVLAKQKKSLAEALEKAPEALTSLLEAYDPKTGSIDSRTNLNEFSMGGGK